MKQIELIAELAECLEALLERVQEDSLPPPALVKRSREAVVLARERLEEEKPLASPVAAMNALARQVDLLSPKNNPTQAQSNAALALAKKVNAKVRNGWKE